MPLLEPIALHLALPVLDLDQATRFYEALGFERFESDLGLAQMRLGNHRLSLKLTESTSPSLQRDGRSGLRSRHFGVRVPRRADVDRAEDWAREMDLLVTEAKDRGDGRAMICVDPSGNQVEVYYAKGDA
jgi:catechol-2,3-dioxygenase